MAKRGISEKSYVVANIFPKVSDIEALTKAGLGNIEAFEELSPLTLRWSYDSGWDKESIILAPGDEHVMRESDARACYQGLAEEGLAFWPVDADEEEKAKAKTNALRRGLTFYRDRGQKKVVEYQKRHNIDPEGERYGLLWINHYNQALADFIGDSLKAMTEAKKTKRGLAA